jgi:hypothetical protein
MSHIVLNAASLGNSWKLLVASYIGTSLTVKNMTVSNTALTTGSLISFNATKFILDDFSISSTQIGVYSLITMVQVNDFTLSNIDISDWSHSSPTAEKYAFEIQKLMSYNSTFENSGTISTVKISSSGLSLVWILSFENTATQLYKFKVLALTSSSNTYAYPLIHISTIVSNYLQFNLITATFTSDTYSTAWFYFQPRISLIQIDLATFENTQGVHFLLYPDNTTDLAGTSEMIQNLVVGN